VNVMDSPSIASVTLNPALDEAIAIDELLLGDTNRCSLDGIDPGGKGINASRVIHRLGPRPSHSALPAAPRVECCASA
jgi:fructose-1-phosphate kinase PfkB-like protein